MFLPVKYQILHSVVLNIIEIAKLNVHLFYNIAIEAMAHLFVVDLPFWKMVIFQFAMLVLTIFRAKALEIPRPSDWHGRPGASNLAPRFASWCDLQLYWIVYV